jgi:hypothetical protein
MAAFPYIQAAKDDQKIYSKESVPNGFILSDPDHLTGFQIVSLYNQWIRRQQKKLRPFIILQAQPHHRSSETLSSKAKGKKRMEYLEVDTDDAEVTSSDEEETGDEEISKPIKFGPPRLGVPGPSTVGLEKTTSKFKSKAVDREKDDRKAKEGMAEISSPSKSDSLARSKKRKADTESPIPPPSTKKRKADTELPIPPPAKLVKSERGGRRMAKVVDEKPTSVSNLIQPESKARA